MPRLFAACLLTLLLSLGLLYEVGRRAIWLQSTQHKKPLSFPCSNLGNWLVLNPALTSQGLVRLKHSALTLQTQLWEEGRHPAF